MEKPISRETLSPDYESSTGEALWLRDGVIIVVDGPDRGRRFVFNPPLARIGTREDNDLVLTDRTVSKYHVAIEEQPEGYLVRDVGSRNGTFVNNSRVREVFLTPGSTIVVGKTVLRFEPPAERVELTPSARDSFGEIRGVSPRIREIFGLLEKVAPSDLPVLITGDTGSGKEVVARSIHQESRRAAKPFVVFDCSALSRDLVDSALFGHQEGAFTGATGKRKGAFLTAAGGTLFIDEIGELALELQPKLLRVLERREIQPLGSDQMAKVDVRVLAATHRDLAQMVAEKSFRHDLLYRLSVVKVRLPPLRERLEDIPILVSHFLEQAGAPGHPIVPLAMDRLIRASWPGNARELKNVLDRALVMAGEAPIDLQHLDLPPESPAVLPSDAGSAGDRKLEEIEAEAIRVTLAKTSWNKSQTARILGIGRNTLLEKIAKYSIKR
ncbi:MAG: sigma 54-dependent Fis family transcriptional regulator [Candidatus Riflebacteria bacterium]|nr:sigma 54-dependent Fis family transcriptional regulator [Candidatus Riflebacteria bacterium]